MKMNQLAKICYFLSVIGILVLLCACPGGGGGGGGGDDDDDDDVKGSGTLSDPYILSAGVTYPAYVQGFQALCGMTFDLSCADFDEDYVSAKFTTPSSGTYQVSFTGIPSNRDLVVYFYRSDSPGSSIIDYIDTLDNGGNGGDEVADATVEAGIDYYMFLQMWGGEADFSARIDKL